MDHKFSEIDHVTPLFNLFLVVHLPTHSANQWTKYGLYRYIIDQHDLMDDFGQ